MDREFGERWLALADWKEDPSALASLPTIDEWAEHVDYVIKLVGADHVAIGLDMVAGRSAVSTCGSDGVSGSAGGVAPDHHTGERPQDRRRKLDARAGAGQSALRNKPP